MILHYLVITIIITVTLGKYLKNDFQKGIHTIQKREPDNWCSATGCTTCVGQVCQQTCKGFNCGGCPSGSCCDGLNCNACYNSFCCSTPSCNYCINTCRQACFNDSVCLNICIPQCQNGIHDVFIVQPNSISPGQQDVAVYIKGVPYKGKITSGKLPTADRNALVSIDGVDSPATVLKLLPVALPTTTVPLPAPVHSPPCGSNSPNCPIQLQPVTNNQLKPGCCHVVHPQQCYNTQTYPYQHCFRRTHQECSNLCSSQFVHLVRQSQQQHQCHFVNTYPYVYCGKHSVQNCDPCYICNGQYNPYSCVQKTGCSNSCKQTFAPPNMATSLGNSQQFQSMLVPYDPQGYYPAY